MPKLDYVKLRRLLSDPIDGLANADWEEEFGCDYWGLIEMAGDAIACGLDVILHTYRTENWGGKGIIFGHDSDEEEPEYVLDFRKANAAIKGAILWNGVN